MDDLETSDYLGDAVALFVALSNGDDVGAQAIINSQGSNAANVIVAMCAWFVQQMEMAGVDPQASARASLARLQEQP